MTTTIVGSVSHSVSATCSRREDIIVRLKDVGTQPGTQMLRCGGKSIAIAGTPFVTMGGGRSRLFFGKSGNDEYVVKKSRTHDLVAKRLKGRDIETMFREGDAFQLYGGILKPVATIHYTHKQCIKHLLIFPKLQGDLATLIYRQRASSPSDQMRRASACYALMVVSARLKEWHAADRAHCDIRADNVLFDNGELHVGDLGSMVNAAQDATDVVRTRKFWTSAPETYGSAAIRGPAAKALDSFSLGILFISVLGFELDIEEFRPRGTLQERDSAAKLFYENFEASRSNSNRSGPETDLDAYLKTVWTEVDCVKFGRTNWGSLIRQLLHHDPTKRLSVAHLVEELPDISVFQQRDFGCAIWDDVGPDTEAAPYMARLDADILRLTEVWQGPIAVPPVVPPVMPGAEIEAEERPAEGPQQMAASHPSRSWVYPSIIGCITLAIASIAVGALIYALGAQIGYATAPFYFWSLTPLAGIFVGTACGYTTYSRGRAP